MPEYEREETYQPLGGFPAMRKAKGEPSTVCNSGHRRQVQLYVTLEEFREIRQAAADLRLSTTKLLERYMEQFWRDLENGTIAEEANRLRDSDE